MKRIARLLAVSLVLLGVMLISLPARALANSYPTADEVYVSGKPISQSTDQYTTYEPSSGTLTITRQVNGISVVSDRSDLDLNIVVDGNVYVYARSKYEWLRPSLVGISNKTGGNITIALTAGSTLHVNVVTADEAASENTHLSEVAGIACNGNVTLTGAEGSSYNVYVRSDWYVNSTLTYAPNLPTRGISAVGNVSIQGAASGKVRVQNHGTAAAANRCSCAVRIGSGSQISIAASGDWEFDSSVCGNRNYPDSYAALFYTDAGMKLPVVSASAGNITFFPGTSNDISYFMLNGNGTSRAMSDLPEVDGHVLDISSSRCKYLKDNRLIINPTTIKLNEMPALGTQAHITADNTVLDFGQGTPRYTMESANWWYRKAGSDSWNMLGETQYLPADATAVRVSFTLKANEGYRFSNTTDVIARFNVGSTITARHTTTRAYMHPAADPSTGTFYIELQLADLAEQHPIDSVKVWAVRPPMNGASAWVETSTSPSTGHSAQINAGVHIHYEWASSEQWGTRPGNQYWTTYDGYVEGDVVPNGTPFQPGHKYLWHGILHAKPGWKFTSDTAISLNDSSVAGVNISADGKVMEVYRSWDCPTLSINSVKVVDQSEPIAGETPVIDGTVPDDAAYSIGDDSCWYEGALNASTYWNATTEFTGTFEADEWYTLVIFLEPDRDNGYGFQCSNDATLIWSKSNATINGEGYEYGYYYSDGTTGGRGRLMILRTFYCTNPDAISLIEIRQTMPVAGQTAKGDATSLTPNVTIEEVNYSDLEFYEDLGVNIARVPANATSLWIGELITEDDQINPNALMPVFENSSVGVERSYMFTARAHAEDGGVFAMGSNGVSATKAFVGGVPAKVQLSDDRTEATVTMFYTMPAPGGGSQQLFVPSGVQVRRQADGGTWYTWSPTVTDYNSTGYDLYNPDADMRLRVSSRYPATWKAPEGEEFYKWFSTSDDVVFEEEPWNYEVTFTMPERDVTIDILTQEDGTLPTRLTDWMIDGWSTSEGWANPELWTWAAYNGNTQWREATLVDTKGTSDTSDDYTLVKGTDYEVSYEPEAGSDTGTYTITYTGIPGPRNMGGYEGSFTTTYRIDTVNIQECDIAVNTAHADDPENPGDDPLWWEYYTGEEIEPSVTVELGDYTLTEGDDYELTYYWNTSVGTATVQVNGKGNFTGWTSRCFEIRALDINMATITSPADVEFNGNYQEPPVTVTYEGETLEKDTDYYAVYYANFDVGTARVEITGNPYQGWTGTKELFFEVKPIDLSSSNINWNEFGPYSYTGEEIKPFDSTTFGGAYPDVCNLLLGYEFDVTGYSDNVYPGEATVTLTGKGNFTGTYDLTFDIRADLSGSYMTYSGMEDIYTPQPGKPVEPKLQVSIDGRTLTEGTDYKLVYENNTAMGNGRVYVRPANERFFEGQRQFDFAIEALNITGAEIAPIPNQSYTGSEVKPKPTVTYGGTTLKAGTDYTVSYENNVEVGTATVTITGKGYFTGTKSASFKILTGIEGAKVTASDVTYNGSAQKPAVTVTLNGTTLKSGVDYTVTYKNNTNVGTATITVTGKGNYTGTATGSFKVKAASISSATVTADAQSYTSGAIKPAPTVKLGSRTLKSGTDYTVSYKSNTAVGTATITVTGKGNYTGTASGTFTITAADLSGAKVTVSGGTYTGSALEPAPTVKLGSKTLKAGTDYTVSYSDNVEVGTATVTVTGKGNYTGTATGTFKITAPEDPGFESPFIDVYEDTYHSEDILWMYYQGISKGWDTPAGLEYRPMESVARCDMAAFLYRLAGSPSFTPSAADKAYFSDVDDETPHCNEVWWLAHEGISKGWTEEDGTHTFRPYDSIARCDMAAFLMRLALGGDAEETYVPSAADLSAFSDIDADSPHANAVWWLANTGVSKGFEDGTFRPYDDIKRCDMAAFLHRMKEYGLI